MRLIDPAQFAAQLLKHSVTSGFGSLSKRDLELLIFFLLERDGALSRTNNSFDVARILNLTVAKTKSLRKDAAARWAGLTGTRQDFLKTILLQVLSVNRLMSAAKHTARDNLNDGLIAVWIEHPGDRLEFERAVLEVGGLPLRDRNAEILLVRFDVLTALAEKHLPVADIMVACESLRALGPVTEELDTLLKKDVMKISLKDLRSVINSLGIKATNGLINISAFKLLGILSPGLAAS